MSLKEEDIDNHDISSLSEDYKQSLDGWTENFKGKYPIVGKIVEDIVETKKDL